MPGEVRSPGGLVLSSSSSTLVRCRSSVYDGVVVHHECDNDATTALWYFARVTTVDAQTHFRRWIWSGHPSLVLFTAAPWAGVHTLENDAQARDVLSLFAGYRRAWASGHWLWGCSSRAGLSQFPRFKTGLSCLDGLFGSGGSVAFCSHCLDQRRRTVLCWDLWVRSCYFEKLETLSVWIPGSGSFAL